MTNPDPAEYQTIPSGEWTRLVGHDLEVRHEQGHPLTVIAQDGRLIDTDGNDAVGRVYLRPAGGFRSGFTAPVAGRYVFGAAPATDRPVDLDAIRARCAAAVPGPWLQANDENTWILYGCHPDLPGYEAVVQILKAPKRGTPYAEYWPNPDTAAFIEHSRTDIPALLGLVDALTAENAQLRNTPEAPTNDNAAVDLDLGRVAARADRARLFVSQTVPDGIRDPDKTQRAAYTLVLHDIPALITEVRQLRAQVAQLQAAEARVRALTPWEGLVAAEDVNAALTDPTFTETTAGDPDHA